MVQQTLTLALVTLFALAPQSAPPAPYNGAADARQLIANAVKVAATDGIRVLVNWGTNGDEACAKFLQMQASSAVDPKFFSLEYKRVYIDVGRADKNLDVAKAYGVTITAGSLPALTVLDDRGKVLANATARDFAGPAAVGLKPELYSSFLSKHQAPAPNAIAQFDEAVTQAKRDGKLVFVWFSAPW